MLIAAKLKSVFTGLVQAKGRIVAIAPSGDGVRLLIEPCDWSYQARPGDSIAINGCCLTHAPRAGDPPGVLAFDIVQQTLDRTTLGRLEVDGRVNLESCLTPAEPIGGHLVQGHIDAVGQVTCVAREAGDYRMAVRVEPVVMPYIVPTGSIAVDGVSLTVANVDLGQHTFVVALIPATLERTTLGDRVVADHINIETDILSRTVIHYLKHFSAAPDAPP